jgi:hypothetical protein
MPGRPHPSFPAIPHTNQRHQLGYLFGPMEPPPVPSHPVAPNLVVVLDAMGLDGNITWR